MSVLVHLLELWHAGFFFLPHSHLPAYLVAAFIKRLARLALTAPPEALLMVIPFICNLFWRHPACKVLMHRPNGPQGKRERGDFCVTPLGIVKSRIPGEIPAPVGSLSSLWHYGHHRRYEICISFLRSVRRSIYHGAGGAIWEQGFGELSLGDSGMSSNKVPYTDVQENVILAALMTQLGSQQHHFYEPADTCLADEMNFWLLFYFASFSILSVRGRILHTWQLVPAN